MAEEGVRLCTFMGYSLLSLKKGVRGSSLRDAEQMLWLCDKWFMNAVWSISQNAVGLTHVDRYMQIYC